MLADTAQLYTELSLRDNGFNAGIDKSDAKVRRLTLDTAKLHSGLGKIGNGLKLGLVRGAILGAGAVGFLALNVKAGIDSLADLEKVQNATNAAIKSTKGIAGLTADAVRDLANKYEDLTTIDDKVIQGGENVLLTFTNIRKKAFEPALAAALDLSVAMGQSLQGSIVQIGKALSDPIKGITALTRVGVTFTEQQKKKIKSLVSEGKLYAAQQIILKELNKEFGGRGKAAADTYAGAQARLKDAVEGLQQALALGLLPALTKISTRAANLLKDPQVVQRVKDLGDTIAGLFSDENIDKGVQGVKQFFGFLRDLPWGVIKDGLSTSAQAAQKAVDIFRGLPPDLQKGLIGLLAVNKLTGGLVASGVSDLLKFTLGSLKTIYAGNVTVIGPSTGGVPGGGPGGNPLIGPIVIAVAAFLGIKSIDAITEGRNSVDNGTVDTTKNPGYGPRTSAQGKYVKDHRPEGYQSGRTDTKIGGSARKPGDPETGDRGSATFSKDTIQGIAPWMIQYGADIKQQLAQEIQANSLSRRLAYLQQRMHEAQEAGNDKRAERLRQKIQQTMAAVENTTVAVKDKKLSVTVNNTVRTTVAVSATAIVAAAERVVLGHKVGFQ